MARLGALGTLADLGSGDIMDSTGIGAAVTINYEDINFGNQYQQQLRNNKSNEQKASSSWLNRASELLDLSSGDSRDTTPCSSSEDIYVAATQQQQQQQQQVPQFVMNPWDPNQSPVITLAPLANAMQLQAAYSHHMLMQQQAAVANDGGVRVLCIPPDEEMGFLLDLPPPCNVLLRPSEIGMSGKTPESTFFVAFKRFLKGESSLLGHTSRKVKTNKPLCKTRDQRNILSVTQIRNAAGSCL